MAKDKSTYTTIQVRKELNELIRKLCKEQGWVAASKTEHYWLGLLSSSMSGSVLI
jgi:hypothetical protein